MALTSDDLQAIAGLIETTIDKKFDEKLEPIKADITGMKGSINRLETDVMDMKGSINRLETDVTDMKGSINRLETDVTDMKGSINRLETDVTDMRGSINRLETDVTDMKTSINRIELIDENEILPRLKNIESCYTSTYDRYAKGIDQLDNMQTDINLLKKVATEHSKKLDNLQKIS